jgi:thiol-disulfide isomerase/thioredoxin
MRSFCFLMIAWSALTANFFAATPGEVGVSSYLREATLQGLNTETKKLSDFRSKPLIINIWANWCGPCRAEMGSLERLAKRFNGNEFNVIGISTYDYRDAALGFIKSIEINFDNFIDHKLELEHILGADTISLTLLVDADGQVLQKARGAYEWSSPKTIDAIADFLT